MSETEGEHTTSHVTADIQIEFYYRGRQEPVQAFATYQVPKGHLDAGDEVQDFMNLACGHLLTQIDTVGSHRIVLGDRRHNKQILLLQDLQGVSMLAPDEETILNQMSE